jgi:beta-galactosidase/beta-glucuronidase
MTLHPLDLVDRDSGAEPAHGAQVSVPRPEYPRPDRDRSERWMSLNGVWRFDADGAQDRILVPFAWESEASGVARTWLESAVYAREVTVPAEWDGARIVLCFGAVHHRAVVAVNGRIVGEHVGGYEYFELDLTDALDGAHEAELTVEVTAPADKRDIPHGKQRSIPRDDYDGVSFTPTSGIWQSVWLEARGRTYAETVAVRGDSLTGFDVTAALSGDVPAGTEVVVEVIGTGERVSARSDAAGTVRVRLDLASARLWSPADPHLYRLRVSVPASEDTVIVTSGLRRFEARGSTCAACSTRGTGPTPG